MAWQSFIERVISYLLAVDKDASVFYLKQMNEGGLGHGILVLHVLFNDWELKSVVLFCDKLYSNIQVEWALIN